MRLPVCIICILLITSTALHAQKNTKLSKKERKELKKKQQEEQKKAISELLKSKAWVIEAHTVYDRYNMSYQINPSINFVGVNKEEGALQLGFNGLIGWNGVGGITIDGKISKYELKEGKGGPSLVLRFEGRGVGTATINISVNTSGQATARVNGNFGERITFSGNITSLDNSTVYKGQALF